MNKTHDTAAMSHMARLARQIEDEAQELAKPKFKKRLYGILIRIEALNTLSLARLCVMLQDYNDKARGILEKGLPAAYRTYRDCDWTDTPDFIPLNPYSVAEDPKLSSRLAAHLHSPSDPIRLADSAATLYHVLAREALSLKSDIDELFEHRTDQDVLGVYGVMENWYVSEGEYDFDKEYFERWLSEVPKKDRAKRLAAQKEQYLSDLEDSGFLEAAESDLDPVRGGYPDPPSTRPGKRSPRSPTPTDSPTPTPSADTC